MRSVVGDWGRYIFSTGDVFQMERGPEIPFLQDKDMAPAAASRRRVMVYTESI